MQINLSKHVELWKKKKFPHCKNTEVLLKWLAYDIKTINETKFHEYKKKIDLKVWTHFQFNQKLWREVKPDVAGIENKKNIWINKQNIYKQQHYT